MFAFKQGQIHTKCDMLSPFLNLFGIVFELEHKHKGNCVMLSLFDACTTRSTRQTVYCCWMCVLYGEKSDFSFFFFFSFHALVSHNAEKRPNNIDAMRVWMQQRHIQSRSLASISRKRENNPNGIVNCVRWNVWAKGPDACAQSYITKWYRQGTMHRTHYFVCLFCHFTIYSMYTILHWMHSSQPFTKTLTCFESFRHVWKSDRKLEKGNH